MTHIVTEYPAVKFLIGNYPLLWVQRPHKHPCDIHSRYAGSSRRSRVVGRLDVPADFFSGHHLKAENSWKEAAGFASIPNVCLPCVREVAKRFGRALDKYDRQQQDQDHYRNSR